MLERGLKMLKEFRAGEKIRHIALLKIQKVGTTSTGGAFARGIVQDNSATLNFICFDGTLVDKIRNFEGFVPQLIIGQMDINKFANDGSLQVSILKSEDVVASDDITHLLPQTPVDIDKYKKKLKEYVEGVKNNFLQILLRSIFSSVYDQYVINPAGSKLHHAYIGGLLEHCVDVADLAVAMAKSSKNMNMDLIVAGALLHDVGKVKEISSEYGFAYTNKGRLLGHIPMGAMIINSHSEKIPQQHDDERLLTELLHIVLSHHGELEKGSPKACASREAFVVHYADELNSILNQFDTMEEKSEWYFSKMINRNLYNPVDK